MCEKQHKTRPASCRQGATPSLSSAAPLRRRTLPLRCAHLVSGLQGSGGANLELPLAGHHLGVDARDDEASLGHRDGWMEGQQEEVV